MGAIEQCMYLLINPDYSVLAQQRCLKTFLPLGSKIVKVYSHVSWISARSLSKISNFNLIHTVCLRPKVLVFLLLLHIQGWALLCPPTSWWRCAVPSADQLFDLLPTRFPPQFGPRGQDLCTEYIMFGSDSGDKHVAASQFSISNAYIIFHSVVISWMLRTLFIILPNVVFTISVTLSLYFECICLSPNLSTQ